MKILIVGTGGVGEAAARIAKERDPEGKWVDLMVISHHRQNRLDQLLPAFADDSRFPLELLDAHDQDAVKALIKKYGIQLLFNACNPSFNVMLFDTAYECGIQYMDMAMSLSTPHPTDPYNKPGVMLGDYQYSKGDDWENKGLLALCGTGMDPGAVNVFARYAQKHYFDEIDEISTKDGGNLTVEGQDVFFGFSIWTTIEECLNPPVVYEKGKGLHTVKPFSDPELFTFPDGIGEQELVNVEHEEVIMIARSMGDAVNRVSFKYALGADFITLLKNLQTLGLDNKDDLVPGTNLTPRDVVGLIAPNPMEIADQYRGKVCVGIQVTGKKDGLERKIYIYQTTDSEECMKRINCGPVVSQTAYNAVIAMELVATGAWTGKGVLGPECFDPEPYIQLGNEYDFYFGMMEMDSPYKKAKDRL